MKRVSVYVCYWDCNCVLYLWVVDGSLIYFLVLRRSASTSTLSPAQDNNTLSSAWVIPMVMKVKCHYYRVINIQHLLSFYCWHKHGGTNGCSHCNKSSTLSCLRCQETCASESVNATVPDHSWFITLSLSPWKLAFCTWSKTATMPIIIARHSQLTWEVQCLATMTTETGGDTDTSSRI